LNFQDLFLDYGDSACGREGELSQIVDTNTNNCNVMIQGDSFSDGELSLDNIQVDRKIFFGTGFFQIFQAGILTQNLPALAEPTKPGVLSQKFFWIWQILAATVPTNLILQFLNILRYFSHRLSQIFSPGIMATNLPALPKPTKPSKLP
jgi:hypothetical protein